MHPAPRQKRETSPAQAADRRALDTRAALSLLETALKAAEHGRSGLAVRAFQAARSRETRSGLEPADLRVRAARAVGRRRRDRTGLRLLRLVTLAAVLLPLAASAEPMDLGDRAARFVSVRFEVSPSDRPGRTDAVYSAPFVARLEPGSREGEVRLTLPGRVVEERLLRDYDPVPGSFSDFVWALDTETGHVISAGMSGRVVRALGFGRLRIEARVRFEMDTRSVAGFRRARRLMGQHVHPFCGPEGGEGCSLVAPSAYDATTGYVNAVGPVEVESRVLRLRTFSTLGEAIFSELDAAAGDRLAALGSDPWPVRRQRTP